MNMTGAQRIAAPREKVFAALNDAEILRRSIPGCEAVEKTSDTDMNARVVVRVGPVKASFAGKVKLSDLDPPKGYTIKGEGSGGMAGFAKGGAHVDLDADGAATLLKYTVNAEVGGKIAQLGGRMIDGTAKKLADEFFQNFGAIVGAPAETPPASAAAAKGLWARLRRWFARLFGSTALAMLILPLSVHFCCLNGHRHEIGDPLAMPICSSPAARI
jgi:carbon monoxide dehydrogenase subunit G